MRREADISFFDEINQLQNFSLIGIIIKDMLDKVIEHVLSSNFIPIVLNAGSIEEDHIMIGQPISLYPDIVHKITNHLFIVNCRYVL